MVDLEKIRIFYHVMKEGSLAGACKVLNKGPATISKHLSDLEKSLGQKLYVRKYQRFELTESGKAFFAIAQNTIPSLEEATSRFRGVLNDTSVVTLLTTTGMAGTWLIDKIRNFHDIYPEVTIKIITTNEHADFKNSKADIGILPKVNSNEGLSQKKIFTVESKLFASQAYLDEYGVPQSLADLDNHRLIGYYSDIKGIRGDVDWHLTRECKNLNGRVCWLTINSAFCQLQAAYESIGILAIPDLPIVTNIFKLVNIMPEYKVCIDNYLMVRNTDLKSDFIKKIVKFLSD